MKIAYITAQTPYGNGEQFILPEILEVINKGNDVIVIPVRPENKIAKGREPEKVSEYTIYIPLLSFYLLLKSIFIFFIYPFRICKIIYSILRNSGNIGKIIKNLVVLPKGLIAGEVIKKHNIEHIHAHWASTPSTVAYIASKLTGISWSFTCHRWDIAENNMLKEKARSARFIRVINKKGYAEILRIISEKYKHKCNIIHVGINSKMIQKHNKFIYQNFVIATPANLIEVKGHKFLIYAIKKLIERNYNVTCYFFGDGPLENELKALINKLELKDNIIFKGKIGHDELLELYAKGEIDCVVLPSIVTDDGEKEGIPVSLMEAMANKIPVISTNTGGIPELLGDGAGILVEQKDPDALAEAIERLINDGELRRELQEKGYKKVYKEFYLPNVVDRLLYLMKG
ncbi:glycosyltransferase family 4 protein [Thermoanaerobacterium sp. DL9XJH110]|uniref:glycosyltransferase family 4 protein n=1 Tax=Thermoanaerobacterium sp. DL9XJH110 TaxID=3386643 RepID=UPI003BB538CD